MDYTTHDGSVSYNYSDMSTQYFISFSLINISQLVLYLICKLTKYIYKKRLSIKLKTKILYGITNVLCNNIKIITH